MKLKTLSETVHLEELDVENVQHFLEQRIERLETLMDKVLREKINMNYNLRSDIRGAMLDYSAVASVGSTTTSPQFSFSFSPN